MLIIRQKHCAIRSHVPARPIGTGLTISITGSKDLMLFEVDEAATRIREEADQDANIIVGASFDESLEGIVRVSVVATGIDNLGAARQAQQGSLTELAGRLRNDSHRSAEPIERSAPRPQLRSPVLPPTTRHPEGLPAKPVPEYTRHAAPHGLDEVEVVVAAGLAFRTRILRPSAAAFRLFAQPTLVGTVAVHR